MSRIYMSPEARAQPKKKAVAEAAAAFSDPGSKGTETGRLKAFFDAEPDQPRIEHEDVGR